MYKFSVWHAAVALPQVLTCGVFLRTLSMDGRINLSIYQCSIMQQRPPVERLSSRLQVNKPRKQHSVAMFCSLLPEHFGLQYCSYRIEMPFLGEWGRWLNSFSNCNLFMLVVVAACLVGWACACTCQLYECLQFFDSYVYLFLL